MKNRLSESFGWLFTGFSVKSKVDKQAEKITQQETIIATDNSDAAYMIGGFGLNVGITENVDTSIREQRDRIFTYRSAVTYPEVDFAVDEICNEAIIPNSMGDATVELDLDEVELSDSIKKKMGDEFENVIKMLEFEEYAYQTFRNWYVDGVMYHQLIIDSDSPKKGIQKIIPLESTCVKPIKEITTRKDPQSGIESIVKEENYYIYDPVLAFSTRKGGQSRGMVSQTKVKLTYDSVVYTHSGLKSIDGSYMVSYLDKVIKPLNNLRALEDATVIYRLTRASEKRAFYIDVGSLPKKSAEEYVLNLMNKFKTDVRYDTETGEVVTNGKQISMTEDFWLPRREGGLGTQIDTIPGGANLGSIDDIMYFQKKLYKGLNIPSSRFEQENALLGSRIAEITRDEWKFSKFVNRLRKQFSQLLLDCLKQQLILKQIITENDWQEIAQDVRVDFGADSYIRETQEIDVIQNKFNAVQTVDSFVGKYVTREWVMRHVLFMNDEEIEKMKTEMKAEQIEFPPEEQDQQF